MVTRWHGHHCRHPHTTADDEASVHPLFSDSQRISLSRERDPPSVPASVILTTHQIKRILKLHKGIHPCDTQIGHPIQPREQVRQEILMCGQGPGIPLERRVVGRLKQHPVAQQLS